MAMRLKILKKIPLYLVEIKGLPSMSFSIIIYIHFFIIIKKLKNQCDTALTLTSIYCYYYVEHRVSKSNFRESFKHYCDHAEKEN